MSLNYIRWRRHPEIYFEAVTSMKPVPVQVDFFQTMSDLSIERGLLSGGRGTSKTHDLALLGIWSIDVLPQFIKMPYRVVIISGSERQAKVLYDHMRRFSSFPTIANKLVGEPKVTEMFLKDGSWIRALPASLTSIHSPRSDLLIVDEAVDAEKKAGGDIILEATPVVIASKYPRIIFSSTPHKFKSIFVDMYLDEERYPLNEYRRFPREAFDCTWIKESEIKKMEKGRWDKYQIAILGKPVPDLEMPYQPYVKDCIYKREQVPKREDGVVDFNIIEGITYMGIDWGFTASPSVIAIVRVTKEGIVWIIRMIEIELGTSAPRIMKVIEREFDRWHCTMIFADSSHMQENERIRRAGLPIKDIIFKNMKPRMQVALENLLREKKLRIHEDMTELIRQLLKYTFDTHKDDDHVDALLTTCIKTYNPPVDFFWKLSPIGKKKQKANEEEEKKLGVEAYFT